MGIDCRDECIAILSSPRPATSGYMMVAVCSLSGSTSIDCAGWASSSRLFGHLVRSGRAPTPDGLQAGESGRAGLPSAHRSKNWGARPDTRPSFCSSAVGSAMHGGFKYLDCGWASGIPSSRRWPVRNAPGRRVSPLQFIWRSPVIENHFDGPGWLGRMPPRSRHRGTGMKNPNLLTIHSTELRRRFSALRSHGNCASRVAIAATVVSCASALGRAGGGGGIIARRARWLRPEILPPRAPRRQSCSGVLLKKM